MRIVFIGTVDFSLSCLQSMLERKAQMVGVFTQSRERARLNADWADLSPLCQIYRVPVFYFRKISDPETAEKIRGLKPEIIFVLGLSQLLPPDFLRIPPIGAIGSHPVLLPGNRGRHPLIWALVKSPKKNSLTLFYIDEGVDSGDIALQREFPIEITDTAKDLYEEIKQLGAEMVRELITRLEKGEAARIPQDHRKATYLQKRNKEDGLIRWEEGAMKAYNLIRALTSPYVGAHTFLNGEEIRTWRALPPGSREGQGKFRTLRVLCYQKRLSNVLFSRGGRVIIGIINYRMGNVRSVANAGQASARIGAVLKGVSISERLLEKRFLDIQNG